MPGEFLDSNVLLYFTSSDAERADRVQALLEARPNVSVQVLNEFVHVARRKFGRSWPEIEEALDRLRTLLQVHGLTEAVHRHGLKLAQRYQLSWYDSLIVAAALSAGCETLYSEDMHHGLLVEGSLRIINPFA